MVLKSLSEKLRPLREKIVTLYEFENKLFECGYEGNFFNSDHETLFYECRSETGSLSEEEARELKEWANEREIDLSIANFIL